MRINIVKLKVKLNLYNNLIIVKNLKVQNYTEYLDDNGKKFKCLLFIYKIWKKDEAICQVLINFISDEKTRTSIPKNSKKHVMTDEIVDFKDDTIKIDSLDSSKGILNLFISINGEKVQSYEENVPNFYKIVLTFFMIRYKLLAGK